MKVQTVGQLIHQALGIERSFKATAQSCIVEEAFFTTVPCSSTIVAVRTTYAS